MSAQFICGGNKFVVGGPGLETIALPISVSGLSATIKVEGCELALRPDFHVSLVCIGKIMEKHSVTLPNFRERVIEDFCGYVQYNDINLLKYNDEFRFASKDEKRSVVVMCDISNLQGFFNLINKKYSLRIEYPPTHVTLYTLQTDRPGIPLTDGEDLKKLTKIIPPPFESKLLNF